MRHRLVPVLLLMAATRALALDAEDLPGTEAVRRAADKSRYWLLNPVPRDQMRGFDTDRPDATESPITLDAGHFGIEMDFVSYVYDRNKPHGSNGRTDSYTVLDPNVRIGLTDRFEMQVVTGGLNFLRDADITAGTVERVQGYGDTLLRFKLNLIGNEGGPAVALMPYVKLPTADRALGNNSVEGGLIVPASVDLWGGWGIAGQVELAFQRDTFGDAYHPVIGNTLELYKQIVENKLRGYVEVTSTASTETHARWISTFDIGLAYKLTPDIQLDLALNIGLTRASPDLNPVCGISVRY